MGWGLGLGVLINAILGRYEEVVVLMEFLVHPGPHLCRMDVMREELDNTPRDE